MGAAFEMTPSGGGSSGWRLAAASWPKGWSIPTQSDIYVLSKFAVQSSAGFPAISQALKTEKGIVLITGCSRSTVEGIIRATKVYLGTSTDLVEGGFHLSPYDATYISNIAPLMTDDLGLRRVAPAHCTGNLAFKIVRGSMVRTTTRRR